MKPLVLAIILGALFGALSSRYLFVGSGLSLIPWSIIGLGIGWLCNNRTAAIKNGAIYGFILLFAFMIAGYNGGSSIISRLPFFAIIGLAGSIYGCIVVAISYFFKSKSKRIRPS